MFVQNSNSQSPLFPPTNIWTTHIMSLSPAWLNTVLKPYQPLLLKSTDFQYIHNRLHASIKLHALFTTQLFPSIHRQSVYCLCDYLKHLSTTILSSSENFINHSGAFFIAPFKYISLLHDTRTLETKIQNSHLMFLAFLTFLFNLLLLLKLFCDSCFAQWLVFRSLVCINIERSL